MGGEKNPDGVKTYPADEHDLNSYVEARDKLAQLQAPTLLDSSDPHARLFVACFDGTGNSMYKTDPKNHTNVAEVAKQLQNGMHDNIGVGYVEGPGTQDGWYKRTVDGVTGGTFEPRVEKMYAQFIEQAKQWKADDPKAKISLAGIGYSRGAEQEAAFSRLVHERGIQDPTGASYSKDKD
ncbi:MAG: phospholipase effector Tle1 domain-containing protein, partial [Lysobacter sp.]